MSGKRTKAYEYCVCWIRLHYILQLLQCVVVFTSTLVSAILYIQNITLHGKKKRDVEQYRQVRHIVKDA